MKGGRVTGVKAEGAESEGEISRGGVGGVDAEGHTGRYAAIGGGEGIRLTGRKCDTL